MATPYNVTSFGVTLIGGTSQSADTLSAVNEQAEPEDSAGPDDPDASAEEYPFTIEELAAETGTSVRNLRSHRARGLLQPPKIRNRTGYYGREHVDRVQLIRQLQDEGFNLGGIKRLLNLARGPSGLLLRVVQTASTPFESEQSRVFTREELTQRFGAGEWEQLIETALRLRLLVPEGDGFLAPSPSLLDAAEEVVELGVPLHHALAVIAKVQRSCEDVAEEFIRLFLDDVWRPFTSEGFPLRGWSEVSGAIETLRPLSSEVLLRTYELTMTRAVERATAEELQRLTKRRRGQ